MYLQSTILCTVFSSVYKSAQSVIQESALTIAPSQKHLHGLTQMLGVVKRRGCHQRQRNSFQFSTQFRLEILDQVFAVHLLEGAFHLDAFGVGQSRQHRDDGLFIGTETLK